MNALGITAGALGSVALHLGLAVVLAMLPTLRPRTPMDPVEFEVPPEPPPPPPPPPPPEPEKPAPAPAPVRPAAPAPRPAAPPPRITAAPAATAVPGAAPVFGVDLSDTSADGTIGAAVGNTTVADPARRGPVKPGPVATAPPPPPPPPPVVITSLPEVISGPSTDGYPPECRQAEQEGIEGTVRLAVVVLDDGRVGDVKLTHGIDRCLDQAAVRLMREIRFKPAQGSDGRPARYRIADYRFRFKINR